MTSEEAKNAAEVMMAFAKGKEIEIRKKGKENWRHFDNREFGWNWLCFDYRVKPELKYRPFEDTDECIEEMTKHSPFGLVRFVHEPGYIIISKIYSKIIMLQDYECDFKVAFSDFTFADGTPFGIKKEEE